VHIATEGPIGWSALRAANRLALPVSSSFHTNFHMYCRHYGFSLIARVALRYLRAFHNRTRCTFVPSRTIQEQLRECGFANLEILGRGVDTELFTPRRRDPGLRREWGADENTPVAIYVGRLAPEKNLQLVVKTYETMRQNHPALRLVLVGDGPSRAAVERQHPDIHFAGLRRGEDLARHYASGDLFLFPSVTETFGNVVTEAMASGLVVLAYDDAAAAEHIETNHNGWKMTLGDSDGFVRAALQLLQREEAWPRWRGNARARVERLTWPAIVAGFEQKLAGLIVRDGLPQVQRAPEGA
jgi:glycosyltransferase involved in cell wall biosynthesis